MIELQSFVLGFIIGILLGLLIITMKLWREDVRVLGSLFEMEEEGEKT
jgi:ABC-type nitrate/sulfonate/bicarbonate transport system permease component